MTEQQIEAAARKLCELRGCDPDAVFGLGHPPNLWYASREIRQHLRIEEAICSVELAGMVRADDPRLPGWRTDGEERRVADLQDLARRAGAEMAPRASSFDHAALARFAALVAEECAKIADAEEALRTQAGQANPEGSPGRDRCFAGARAATNCAWNIRAAFPMPKE